MEGFTLIPGSFYGILILYKYIHWKGTIQMTNQAKLTLLSRIRLVCIILAVCLLAASAAAGWMTYTEEKRVPTSVPDVSVPHREGKYDNDDLPTAVPNTANAGMDLFGNPPESSAAEEDASSAVDSPAQPAESAADSSNE